ncbi:MAG: carbohydrate-binding family 9-like protein [Muribaculum sp.]|nr:carbohydrate-binding family 9-like protein [Muribaculaceae bacterium]MCM1080992.1 carbohydrate-binding family 9-like protein [Muribaculum sp.]
MEDTQKAQLLVPKIEIDSNTNADNIIGLLEESGVRANIDCVNWAEYPYKPLTTFSMAHTDTCLFIDFFVRCNYLSAMNYETNSPVHEDSSVAMSIQTNEKDNKFFYFEFNCIGTKAGYICEPEGECKQITKTVLDNIKVSPSCGVKPFRELEGLFSWNILVEIPFKVIDLEEPIESNKKIKCNFFKCASGTQQPHFLSWQPVVSEKPDFKILSSFKSIILEQ